MTEPSLYELIQKYEAIVLELEADNRALRKELQHLKDTILSLTNGKETNQAT